MMAHHPFVLTFGALEISGFGIAVLLAFAIASTICSRELARRGHDPTPVPDLVLAAVLGTLVGAKLYYVAIITHNPRDLLSRAGFVYWGGFIGAVIATAWVIRRKHLQFSQISDVAGIAIAAGYAVGRTGCWAVGDDYGRPWASRWAVAFPEGSPPSTASNMASMFHVRIPPGTPPNAVLSVYPTQLFEVVLGFVMFLILWRLRDHRHAGGWLFGVYCVLAGIERFAVEFFRAKDDRFFGVLSAAQLISIVAVAAGLGIMRLRSQITLGQPGVIRGVRIVP